MRPIRSLGTCRLLGATLAAALCVAAAPAFAQKAVATKKVAPGLYELAVSPSTGEVYVASVGRRNDDSAPPAIHVLDPLTLETKRTIDVSSAAAFGIALNDRTQTLYTSNTRDGSASAIDAKTGKIINIIRAADEPKAHLYRVVVDEEDNRVYMSNTAGRVWVVDGTSNTLAYRIEGIGEMTTGLWLDKPNNRLFAVNLRSEDVAVVDIGRREVVKRIPVGVQRPTHVVYHAPSKTLFVGSQAAGNVSAIDVEAGKVVATIPAGAGTLGMALHPKTGHIYVANRQDGTVTVIDAASRSVVTTIEAGSLPNTVAIDANSGRVYVSNKARSGGRNAPPVDDPSGDTVTLIEP